jgi:hypothetical protein
MKRVILSLLSLAIMVGTTSGVDAKDVKVKGYTKKDGTKVESYTRHDKDSDTVKVKGYTKKDGTKVEGYERKKATK